MTPLTHSTVQAVTADVAARSRLPREHYLSGVRARAGGAVPHPGPASVALVDVHVDPAATQLARDRIRAGGAIARSADAVAVRCSEGQLIDGLGHDTAVMSTALALLTTPSTGALVLGACPSSTPDVLLGAVRAGHVPVLLVACACPDADGDTVAALLAQVLGMQLPGGADAAEAVVRAATRVLEVARPGPGHRCVGEQVDERMIVNAAVALLAAGGPDRHVAQLVAIARAAGMDLRREHLDALASVVPAAGHDVAPTDVPLLIQDLLAAGLLHPCAEVGAAALRYAS